MGNPRGGGKGADETRTEQEDEYSTGTVVGANQGKVIDSYFKTPQIHPLHIYIDSILIPLHNHLISYNSNPSNE